MADLPYAEPDGPNFNERLGEVLDASRHIDEFCERTRRGLLIHPETYQLHGAAGGLSRYSPYPIVRADAVTADGAQVADYEICGERENIVAFETAQKEPVRVMGLFGYGRIERVGMVLAGHSLTAAATALDAATFGDAPAAPAGRVFLIGSELMYSTGTALVRGANGTRAVEHGAGMALYRVVPPAVVEQAARVVSQALDASRAKARDTDRAEELREAIRNEGMMAKFEGPLLRYRYRGPLTGW